MNNSMIGLVGTFKNVSRHVVRELTEELEYVCIKMPHINYDVADAIIAEKLSENYVELDKTKILFDYGSLLSYSDCVEYDKAIDDVGGKFELVFTKRRLTMWHFQLQLLVNNKETGEHWPMANVEINLQRGDETSWIKVLYVDRICRRKGIATALMMMAKHIVKTTSIASKYIALTTTAAGRPLYESLGYKTMNDDGGMYICIKGKDEMNKGDGYEVNNPTISDAISSFMDRRTPGDEALVRKLQDMMPHIDYTKVEEAIKRSMVEGIIPMLWRMREINQTAYPLFKYDDLLGEGDRYNFIKDMYCEWDIVFYAKINSRRDLEFFVAIERGWLNWVHAEKVIAHACVDIDSEADHAYAVAVWTNDNFRRLGISTALMMMIEYTVKTFTTSSAVGLHASDVGRLVYEKLGYTRPDKVGYDSHYMTKKVR